MKFVIVGPGSMGCLFGARLKNAGHDVTLVDHLPDRADFINRQGIRVEGIKGEFAIKVRVETNNLKIEPDIALICVKASQTEQAACTLNQWLSPGVRVMTLQNGLGNVEILENIFGKKRVLGGVTAEGATLLGDGHIRHAGQGQTIIGPETSDDNKIENIVSAFIDAGFDTKSTPYIDEYIWGKLIINVGINALTAITRLKNGRLPAVSGTRKILELAVVEAMEVVNAKGIRLPYPDPLGRVLEVCNATSGNIASMLQDVLNKRETEIDFINGAIVKEGKKLGISTPVNQTLTCLVESVSQTYDEAIFM